MNTQKKTINKIFPIFDHKIKVMVLTIIFIIIKIKLQARRLSTH